jgi:fatty acid desaturase
MLSRGDDTEKTDRLFSSVISSVIDLKPLAISAKRMPKTLLLFVTLTAVTLLFLLLFFPFHNLALGMVAMAIATLLLFFAHFVLTDLDNPFEGTWNVRSEPFSDLVTKLR